MPYNPQFYSMLVDKHLKENIKSLKDCEFDHADPYAKSLMILSPFNKNSEKDKSEKKYPVSIDKALKSSDKPREKEIEVAKQDIKPI